MAGPGNFTHRVFVEDIRSDGKYLRMTWHPELSGFIVSNWDGDVCVGATRVPVDAAPQLVQLLTNGMADALSAARDEPWTVGPHPSTSHDEASATVLDFSADRARLDDDPKWSSLG
jgi:hypothetical protein